MIGMVLGGTASGVGKTTVTLGIIGALSRRGLSLQPFKVGPDYIDPSQHSQVAGRPSRTLDSWMVPEAGLRELFARSARTADAAVVEGVMGLFDGRTGAGEVGSTAQVARLLGLPVLLVVDAAKAGRTVAATVAGCRVVDPDLELVGVILNNVASERHAQICRDAVESLAGLPVVGSLPRDPDLRQDERYLGLVPAAERRVAPELVERVVAQVEAHVDLERLLSLTQIDAPVVVPSGLFPGTPIAPRVRIALAQDEAFNFYYQDSLDLLAAWGAELVPFSPLRDTSLPERIGGVYLGGGFPELFAGALAANRPMLGAIRRAAAAGLPVYAECGGLMYLQEGLVDADDVRHPMAGLLPGTSTLLGARLALGYREIHARRDTLLTSVGAPLRGHEFHWSRSDPPPAEMAAYDVADGSGRSEGFATGSVLASYVHLHFAADQMLAPRFVEACAAALAASDEPPTLPVPGPLLGQYGLPPSEIEPLSRRRIEERLGDRLPTSEPKRGLAARLVYAGGDPELAERIAIVGDPVAAAIEALQRKAALVVDVEMVAAGISRQLLSDLDASLHVAIKADGIAEIARAHRITRSAAGILALADHLDGAVVAIGNAPTALLALLDLVATARVRPAAVVGMPVGFVAAEESKEHLLASGLPCVVVRGTRGGSGLAAAAVNLLLKAAVAARHASPSRS